MHGAARESNGGSLQQGPEFGLIYATDPTRDSTRSSSNDGPLKINNGKGPAMSGQEIEIPMLGEQKRAISIDSAIWDSIPSGRIIQLKLGSP